MFTYERVELLWATIYALLLSFCIYTTAYWNFFFLIWYMLFFCCSNIHLKMVFIEIQIIGYDTVWDWTQNCGQSLTNVLFFICVGQNNFTGCNYFFDVPCKKLTKKMKKKCPKLIQSWLCIKYCTDRLTLRHAQLFDRSLEVKVKHLEAR